MKDTQIKQRVNQEVLDFINSRKSLLLSTLTKDGQPYASYAPFAIGDECLYVLLSEIALHAVNLQHSPNGSVLIIQDEDSSKELFARLRVNYTVKAELIAVDSEQWQPGITLLAKRLGKLVNGLSQLADFKLFKLKPQGGRFVKGFGRAYTLVGDTLAGEEIKHLTKGHKKRRDAA